MTARSTRAQNACFALLALLFTSLIPHTVFGDATSTPSDADCGVIERPADPNDPFGTTTSEAVTDCADPFGATEHTFPLPFHIGGSPVSHNDEAVVPVGGTNTYGFEGEDGDELLKESELYKHTNAGYTYYPMLEDATGTSTKRTLTPGTYTLVFKRDPVRLAQRDVPLFIKLATFITPTAHAQMTPPGRGALAHVLTFTLVEEVPETDGPSNVLFLPGIQASRLYRGNGDGVGERVWEPGSNNDVRALTMSSGGESEHDIRTDDVIDQIAVPFFGADIYGSFLRYLESLVADGTIEDWEAFPYDWRRSVFDVVEQGTVRADGTAVIPADRVRALAETSKSGQVTIVAHSNGGLLAKALYRSLSQADETNLVDRIIFVGTPHTGTPKSIGTVLHGYEQEQLGGLVVDDVVARDVLRNFPAVYHLLPSVGYVAKTDTPLVTFASTTPTHALRNVYGGAITDYDAFAAFLRGDENTSARQDSGQINQPRPVNAELLARAEAEHQLLSSWSPASSTEVLHIVGTGLPTVESVQYHSINERVCELSFPELIACEEAELIKPFVSFSQYGDETVMSHSAAGKQGEVVYFDLLQYSVDFKDSSFSHANILTSKPLKLIIGEILRDDEIKYSSYLNETEREYDYIYRIEAIDSPVALFATDRDGRITGVKNGEAYTEIPGSRYVTFGGTKYLLVPADTEYTTTLTGEATGSFTYTLATLSGGDTQTVNGRVRNATTTPDLVGTVTHNDGESILSVDSDGDGTDDHVFNVVTGTSTTPTTEQTSGGEAESEVIGGGGGPVEVVSEPPEGEVLGVATSTGASTNSAESEYELFLNILKRTVDILTTYQEIYQS